MREARGGWGGGGVRALVGACCRSHIAAKMHLTHSQTPMPPPERRRRAGRAQNGQFPPFSGSGCSQSVRVCAWLSPLFLTMTETGRFGPICPLFAVPEASQACWAPFRPLARENEPSAALQPHPHRRRLGTTRARASTHALEQCPGHSASEPGAAAYAVARRHAPARTGTHRHAHEAAARRSPARLAP